MVRTPIMTYNHAKCHWMVGKRFGMAGGKYTHRRILKRMSVMRKCVKINDLKIKILKKKCNFFVKNKCKRTFCLGSTVNKVEYKCKRISDLKIIINSLKHTSVKGYRLINLDCLQSHMNYMLKHTMTCSPTRDLPSDSDFVEIVSEIRTQGLATVLGVRCIGCKALFHFETSPKLKVEEDRSKYDVNVRAVWGSIVTGNGASHLKEMMATMDAPSLSQPAFTKLEQDIGNWWENMCQEESLAAGAEERRIAIEKNSYHQGVPCITVIADGGWSKRTHKHSYNGLGGVGIIIGKETGKILYMGVRNKHCYICSHARNTHEIIPPHVCYKNWDSNSQSMESDIIVKGFQMAEKTHGLRYMWLIGDGDSSVFARIREEVPDWGPHVEKIECANHVCKCLRSNLEKLVENNPSYKGKNNLTKSVRIRLVSAIRCAIRMRAKESDKHIAAVKLDKDIRNSIHHIFGRHDNCSDFCKVKSSRTDSNMFAEDASKETSNYDEPTDVCTETSLLWSEGSSLNHQEMSRYGYYLKYSDLKSNMLQDISVLLDRVASKSKRLIHNTTTNLAECWMHIRTKFDGGKVYNLCNRGSWHTRCYGGSLRMNLGTNWSPIAWKNATGTTPGHNFESLYFTKEKQLQHSNASKRKPEAAALRWKRKVASATESSSKLARKSYGSEAQDVEPDISPSELKHKISQFLDQHINISSEKIKAIELLTKNQSESKVWHDERKKRISASNFGFIVKRRPNIPIKNLVKQLIYKTFKGNAFTKIGLQQERVTIHEYVLKQAEMGINVVVQKSGFVINDNAKFLGGSPDGVVFINGKKCGLIEVKNVLYNKPINLDEAAKTNKNFFLKLDNNKLKLKTNHNYYIQCQGLINVCNVPWIDFVVRTTNPYQLHIERINKNSIEWQSWVPKLKAFFEIAMLPELASPRHDKVPGIREPGIWYKDKQPTGQVKSSTLNTCVMTESVNVEKIQILNRNRRQTSSLPKFLGRNIHHKWKLSENTDETKWFKGNVLSVISGKDGCQNAVYEVLYDNENEPYEVDHLVEDYLEGSVQFLDL